MPAQSPPSVRGSSSRLQISFSVRGYLFDDGGALRQHVTVFVDGDVVTNRTTLAQKVRAEARVDVLQALSGG